ncbi:acyltransferase family protein [Flagellimonas flava]|uniref:acyltransferase family protein n=1 Tax=Flagellimonas flava TaxID=570519 RepID=UPI003D64E1E1
MDKRIDNLDYLRGLMAIVIMIYHYNAWLYGALPSDSTLSRLGIYGVSAFYVLSGLTLFLVYSERLVVRNLPSYFLKRILRIYPLLWISILLNIFLLNKTYPTEKLWLNFTGAFGFVAPREYISTGAWSIGNELVFYVFFPLIVLLSRRFKYGIWLCFGVSVLVGYYFAFHMLDPEIPLGDQWDEYINPFNQLFLFVGGMFVAFFYNGYKNVKLGWSLFLLAILIFVIWPASGNRIALITENNRLVFSTVTILFTISFLIIPNRKIKFLSSILKVLGHISYSIYLIHPIVFWYLNRFLQKGEEPVKFFLISSLITLILSLLVYYLVESRFIRLGKSLVTNRLNKRAEGQ